MKKILFIALTVLPAMLWLKPVDATEVVIDINVPEIDSSPYHRPYIAVWLETPKRKGVHTFAFWKEQEEWFKDLRQWWRKIGRANTPNFDSVSGPTRKPGEYQLTWDGTLSNGQKVSPGEYVLHFESVREQGSREYLRQPITIAENKTQTFTLQGKQELGLISISVK
ncbi:DUF2271 domain-containing protein [Shewanella saliphila]|uniref:DUF2271 domain-containing protein n=1 Tax=Shewanella saliphila TaxID=2282698 RepID=A0ABQ2Q9L5_9GAMM|nr:DUF2271 domain-containing protein [Shewanella saliphila]MCL1101847.1 DUF2271 domain-containing protein [Shewanella saliphila]GGP59404.1 hypothetical protein GCM10009409_26560 [Shewanella saliphila]